MPRIGRYEVIQELGRGAMGAVFQARDPEIGRTVAIKTILTSVIPPEELPQFKMRFRREAQLAGQMSHPGIVTIHDIAEDETGQPYLVMEFIEGMTLHQMLRAGADGNLPERLPLAQSLGIVTQVAEALNYAHERGVVHRDIKPGNILIMPDGRAKITDFGIAKFSGSETTHTVGVLGTPAYMSPEQVRGSLVDRRSDIFSLGAMIYWMTTGQKPFPGDTSTTISFKVVYLDPTPPSQLDKSLPNDLDTILSRCLAKDPDHRYSKASLLAADLAALREGRPIATTPAPTVSAANIGTGEETAISSTFAVRKKIPGGDGIAAAVREATGRGPGQQKPWLMRPHNLVAVASAALLIALAVMFLRPGATQNPAQPTGQPTAANSSAPPSTPNPSGGAPNAAAKTDSSATEKTSGAGEKAVPAASKPTSAPVKSKAAARPMSTLEIECNHNFKEATMEIYVGKEKVFESDLANKVQLNGTAPIRAGEQKLRVRVESKRDKFIDEKEITGDFAVDGSRKLIVDFGRGSGFGLGKRDLRLRWK